MKLYNVIYCDNDGCVKCQRFRATDEDDAENQAWFDLNDINYVIEVREAI